MRFAILVRWKRWEIDMTDDELTSELTDALTFGNSVKKANLLGKQTNAILSSLIGLSIGSAIPTGFVLAFGAAYSPFIVMGTLAGGALGLLYWRTRSKIPDIDETSAVNDVFDRRDRDLKYIDARLALPALDVVEREMLLDRKKFYLNADAALLIRNFQTRDGPDRLLISDGT